MFLGTSALALAKRLSIHGSLLASAKALVP